MSDELVEAGGTATAPAPEVATTWTWNDQEYPLLLCNRTGNIGIPVMHPADATKKIAILGAGFAWESDKPFVDHLNLKRREEMNVRTKETQSKSSNLVQQNAELFDQTVQNGYLIKIDEFGVESDPIEKTRAEMLAYPAELQSDLMDAWLGKFSAERYIPAGQDDIDSLLTEPDTVHFICRIGDYKTPAHVLHVTFKTPPAEARRSFESDMVVSGKEQEGNVLTTTYMFRNEAKMKFARKFLLSIEGCVLAKTGELEPDTSTIQAVKPGDATQLELLKKNFNPHWFVVLANSLNDCFGFTGK